MFLERRRRVRFFIGARANHCRDDGREMFPPELAISSADVMVSIWNEESFADSLALAQELRRTGLPC